MKARTCSPPIILFSYLPVSPLFITSPLMYRSLNKVRTYLIIKPFCLISYPESNRVPLARAISITPGTFSPNPLPQPLPPIMYRLQICLDMDWVRGSTAVPFLDRSRVRSSDATMVQSGSPSLRKLPLRVNVSPLPPLLLPGWGPGRFQMLPFLLLHHPLLASLQASPHCAIVELCQTNTTGATRPCFPTFTSWNSS